MLDIGGWLEFQPHFEISGHGLKLPETRHIRALPDKIIESRRLITVYLQNKVASNSIYTTRGGWYTALA
jgi:hypothetical protein